MFDNIQIELYGESHSKKIGAKVVGLDGISFDACEVDRLLARRSAGGIATTSRREKDDVHYVGAIDIKGGVGSIFGDIDIFFENTDVKRVESTIARPSHCDLVSYLRYGYIKSGGGEFSARMTAPLCVVGGIAKSVLKKFGIDVVAYLSKVGDIECGSYQDSDISLIGLDNKEIERLQSKGALLDESKKEEVDNMLLETIKNCDSVGARVECIVQGVKPASIGDSMLNGLEGKLASAIYAIPGVKGVEFGKGFGLVNMIGSVANDPICTKEDGFATTKNDSGGINGGIANGMPITMAIAFRPTPTIAKEQQSVDVIRHENAKIQSSSRNDACIAIRGVAVVESMVAIALLDELINAQNKHFININCDDKTQLFANNDNLSDARCEIDLIDKSIAKLLDKRMDICKSIASIKKENAIKVLDINREKCVVDNVTSCVKDEYIDSVKHVYECIMNESKALQEKE